MFGSEYRGRNNKVTVFKVHGPCSSLAMTSPYSPTSFPGSSLLLYILYLKVSFPHWVGEAFGIALNFFIVSV